jgi:hypothetical protein
MTWREFAKQLLDRLRLSEAEGVITSDAESLEFMKDHWDEVVESYPDQMKLDVAHGICIAALKRLATNIAKG